MNSNQGHPPHRRRLLGAILCLLSAGLTIVATFLPLLDTPGDANYYTAWGFVEGSHISPPMYGYPLVIAAVVLLAAALALLASALVSVQLGTGRVAGATSLAGSAMLLGLTWALVLHESSIIGNMAATNRSEEPVEVSLGAGVWLLVAGVLLAIVATVLALLPARPSRPWPATQPGGQPAAAAQPYPAPWPGTVQNRPTQATVFGRP